MLMRVFVSIDAASIARGTYSPMPVEAFLLLMTCPGPLSPVLADVEKTPADDAKPILFPLVPPI